MKCDLCDGTGTLHGLVRRTDGCRPGSIPCPDCRGTGIGIDYPAHWKPHGEKLRQLREEKDLSTRECARLIGVRPSELSEAETGRRDPSLFLTRIGDCPARESR